MLVGTTKCFKFALSSDSDSESELAESSSRVARGRIGSRGGVRVGLAGAAVASWGGPFPPT